MCFRNLAIKPKFLVVKNKTIKNKIIQHVYCQRGRDVYVSLVLTLQCGTNTFTSYRCDSLSSWTLGQLVKILTGNTLCKTIARATLALMLTNSVEQSRLPSSDTPRCSTTQLSELGGTALLHSAASHRPIRGRFKYTHLIFTHTRQQS